LVHGKENSPNGEMAMQGEKGAMRYKSISIGRDNKN